MTITTIITLIIIGLLAGVLSGLVGVGGGIIIDGEIFRGSKDMGGEIGHIPVISRKNGSMPRCTCGNIGCLESLISIKAIVNKAKKLIDEGFISALRNEDIGAIGFEEIVNAAKNSAAIGCV